MYEPPSVAPSEHDAAPEPEFIAAILQRVACLANNDLLGFVPTQVRVPA